MPQHRLSSVQHILAALVVALCLFNTSLFAEERITHFHSDIEVLPDRSLRVQERIEVISQQASIRRGIYRDFPTVYPHPHWGKTGIMEKTGFELISVMLDDQPGNWHQVPLENGVRTYIGDSETYLPAGEHSFELSYRSPGQISRLAKLDILNWNVNGQDWVFPIDKLSATVRYPEGYPVSDFMAWTGRAGEKGSDYEGSINPDGSLSIETTRPFAPYEGMTLMLTLPPSIVDAPDSSLFRLFKDNYLWFIGLLLLGFLPYYYYRAWLAVGRDPQKGVVVADYHPVRNLSPAAHRFVVQNHSDDTALTAMLVNMAIKGFVRIEQLDKKSFVLHNTLVEDKVQNGEVLTANEKIIHDILFNSADQISLGKKYNSTVAKAKKRLDKLLKNEWQEAVYRNNQIYSWIGLGVGLATLVLFSLHLGNRLSNLFQMLPMTVILIIGIVFSKRKSSWLNLVPAVVFTMFAAQQGIFSFSGSSVLMWLGLIVIGLYLLFYYLLKAPTPFGQKLLDEIEGFRLYLGTAEQHRLNLLHPPDRTPELFEKLLPYAIALDVENEWSSQFTGILSNSTTDKQAYEPNWYSGNRRYGFSSSGFGSSLGAGLSSSVASAARSPSSSSGGFSGGGAGGGGGGGGGGGW